MDIDVLFQPVREDYAIDMDKSEQVKISVDMYMYAPFCGPVHCSRNPARKKHLADSELSAWKIKLALALYRAAAAHCQGGSQKNGRVTFL